MRRLIVPFMLCLALPHCSTAEIFTDEDATVMPDSGVPNTNDASPSADGTTTGDLPGTTYSGPKKMYAHSATTLYVIDPTTYEISAVGEFGLKALDEMNDIAVTPNGKIYGVTAKALYQIDHLTAAASWVVNIPATTNNVALTFEVNGTLLASDKGGSLRRIDPKTGQISEIGQYGLGYGSSGDLVAIADGTLFGVSDVGSGASENNILIRIDPTTGAASTIGPTGFARIWGLAFWGGTIYGFTREGAVLRINAQSGAGSVLSTYSFQFFGAAVTPRAPIE